MERWRGRIQNIFYEFLCFFVVVGSENMGNSCAHFRWCWLALKKIKKKHTKQGGKTWRVCGRISDGVGWR
jgi:hypothetical protein